MSLTKSLKYLAATAALVGAVTAPVMAQSSSSSSSSSSSCSSTTGSCSSSSSSSAGSGSGQICFTIYGITQCIRWG